MSNNPPDVILELTVAEARFLLDNCESNLHFAMNAMQNGDLSQPALEKLVAMTEQFKVIRQKLLLGGVE